jgi:hypothetical protein
LINGGYLATSSIKTFGVYNSATEDAFNKWQIDRDKQYYANNNLSDTNTVVDNKATSTNWFVDFFKSVISFFKNVLKL